MPEPTTLVTSGFGAPRTTTVLSFLPTTHRTSTTSTTLTRFTTSSTTPPTTTTKPPITTVPPCASSCTRDLRLVLNADGCPLPTAYPPQSPNRACEAICSYMTTIWASSYCCIHSACPLSPASDSSHLNFLVGWEGYYSEEERWTVNWLEALCAFWGGVNIIPSPVLECVVGQEGFPTVGAGVSLLVHTVGGKGEVDMGWVDRMTAAVGLVPIVEPTATAGGIVVGDWREDAGRSLVVILGSCGVVFGALCVVAYYCRRWYERVTGRKPKRKEGKRRKGEEDIRAETEGLMEMGVQDPRKELDGRPISELGGRESLLGNRGRQHRKRSPLSQVHMSPELKEVKPAERSPLARNPVGLNSEDQVVSPLVGGQSEVGSPLMGSDVSPPTQGSLMVGSDVSPDSGGLVGEGSPFMGADADADARPKAQEPVSGPEIARNSIRRKLVGSPDSRHRQQGGPSPAATGDSESAGLLENEEPRENAAEESTLERHTRAIELVYGRDWVEM